MNSKIVTGVILVAGGLMLPLAGHAADSDNNMTTAPKGYMSDAVTTTKVKTALAEEKMASLVHIGVDTDSNGLVTLSGTAASQSAAVRAVAIARTVAGVTGVANHIQIVADNK